MFSTHSDTQNTFKRLSEPNAGKLNEKQWCRCTCRTPWMNSISHWGEKMEQKKMRFVFCCESTLINISLFLFCNVSGSVLTKESLMKRFDSMIVKARNFLQRAFLLLSFPAFKMCCAVVMFWIDAFTKSTGINVAFEVSVKLHASPSLVPPPNHMDYDRWASN